MAATEERRIDVKAWIMRGGTDQPDIARFHIRKEEILLRFIEAVDFVDEKDGLRVLLIAREPKDVAHLGHIGEHGVDPYKFALSLGRNDLRERSFTTTGRAIENEAAKVVRLNEARKKASLAQNMILPDHFFEATRTHTHR